MVVRELGASYFRTVHLGVGDGWGSTPGFAPAPAFQAFMPGWTSSPDVFGGFDPGLAQGNDLLRAFVGAQAQPQLGMPLDMRQMLQSLNASDGRMMAPLGCGGGQGQSPIEMQLSILLQLLIEYLAQQLMNGAAGRDLGSLGGCNGGGGAPPIVGGAGPSGGAAPSAGGAAPASGVTPPGNANAGENVERWRPMVREYAARHGIAPGEMAHFENFVLTMMKVESGGNPNAIGDNGHSVGLFQLHDRGVGHGMSVEQRKDPHVQFEAMMPRFVDAYRSGLAKGLDGAQLAIHIAREAERPAAWALPKYGKAYDAMFA